MSELSLTRAQQQFTAHLPAVVNATRYAFRSRKLRRHDYEDILAEAIAACWSAWVGLVSRGRDPLEVGVCGIANQAARYVRNGRRVGNTTCGRGAMDVFRKAQKARDLKVVSLDSNDQFVPGWLVGTWKEWLACDHRVGPADEAAFRVDFAVWLTGLPERKRQIAVLLTEGHEPGLVASIVGVSPARVSQLRHELEVSWRKFQEPAALTETGDPRTARV
jgi:DNA-directed RNA polymerase specialized sigma24 family protein